MQRMIWHALLRDNIIEHVLQRNDRNQCADKAFSYKYSAVIDNIK